jgi:hypothetical protein
MTYRMIVRTETTNSAGRTDRKAEIIHHIPEAEVESHRAAARLSAPRGATRTIKVVSEN